MVRRLLLLVVVAVFLVATTGYAATNTFAGGNARKAGDGRGSIAGYALAPSTTPVFTLDSNDPRIVASVRFQLNSAATKVRAAINASSPTVLCTAAGPPNTWDCALNAQAATATSLYVAAAQ